MFYDKGEFKTSSFDKIVEIIQLRAKKYFGWTPRPNEQFFIDSQTEPFSDNPRLLKQALAEHINQADVVLTTPTHKSFFEDLGVQNITIYDISPAQLTANPSKKMFWCDIFHPKLLVTLLHQVQPSAMYLSNIPEYAKDEKKLSKLVQTINNFPSVKKVLLSRTLINPGPSDNFASQLESTGWKLHVLSEAGNRTDRIFALTRKSMSL